VDSNADPIAFVLKAPSPSNEKLNSYAMLGFDSSSSFGSVAPDQCMLHDDDFGFFHRIQLDHLVDRSRSVDTCGSRSFDHSNPFPAPNMHR